MAWAVAWLDGCCWLVHVGLRDVLILSCLVSQGLAAVRIVGLVDFGGLSV